MILIGKAFPHSIDVVHAAQSRFQRIHTPIRRQPCMGTFSGERNSFENYTVPAVTQPTIRLCFLPHHMAAQHHIHIVKHTQSDHFLLTTEEKQFSAFPQCLAVVLLDDLFCRYADEGEIAIQFFDQATFDQAQCGTENRSQLGMMSTAMEGPSFRMTMGMARHNQRIQFAHQSQIDFMLSSGRPGLQAGQCNFVFYLQTAVFQNLFDIGRCFIFFETGLRHSIQVSSDLDQQIPVPLNDCQHSFL